MNEPTDSWGFWAMVILAGIAGDAIGAGRLVVALIPEEEQSASRAERTSVQLERIPSAAGAVVSEASAKINRAIHTSPRETRAKDCANIKRWDGHVWHYEVVCSAGLEGGNG